MHTANIVHLENHDTALVRTTTLVIHYVPGTILAEAMYFIFTSKWRTKFRPPSPLLWVEIYALMIQKVVVLYLRHNPGSRQLFMIFLPDSSFFIQNLQNPSGQNLTARNEQWL